MASLHGHWDAGEWEGVSLQVRCGEGEREAERLHGEAGEGEHHQLRDVEEWEGVRLQGRGRNEAETAVGTVRMERHSSRQLENEQAQEEEVRKASAEMQTDAVGEVEEHLPASPVRSEDEEGPGEEHLPGSCRLQTSYAEAPVADGHNPEQVHVEGGEHHMAPERDEHAGAREGQGHLGQQGKVKYLYEGVLAGAHCHEERIRSAFARSEPKKLVREEEPEQRSVLAMQGNCSRSHWRYDYLN